MEMPVGRGPRIHTALWTVILLTAIMFSGCYYTKQGRYLVSHQWKAHSIKKLLRSSDLTDETRNFLLIVQDIRQFSRDELGLADNKNYTTFLDIDQDTLAWVVSAASPLALKTFYWNYPFLGEMPYKGFYQSEDARLEGKSLSGEGFDVWIRGVDAFSTLGFFRDPLYSFMIEYPVHRLANLIIHEQTHATIWRKGESAFNEDLASFVGDEGARLYIMDRYGEDSDEFRNISLEKDDYDTFLEDIFSLRAKLEEFYSGIPELTDTDTSGFLEEKEKIINDFKIEFALEYESRYRSDRFLAFSDLPVNNAYLELFQLYDGQRSWFEEEYARAGFDMKVFLSSL